MFETRASMWCHVKRDLVVTLNVGIRCVDVWKIVGSGCHKSDWIFVGARMLEGRVRDDWKVMV